MNKYSNFPFLNTLLELHHMMNFDKIFSIFHWTMIKKNYLVEHPEGHNEIPNSCEADSNGHVHMGLKYAHEDANDILCDINIDNNKFTMMMSTIHHNFSMELQKNKYLSQDGNWNEHQLIELINYFQSTLNNFRLEEKRKLKITEKSQQQPVGKQSRKNLKVKPMNNYSYFTFINTLLVYHDMMKFDKIFSICHWVMIKKNYLVKHPEGNNEIPNSCDDDGIGHVYMNLRYAHEKFENDLVCQINIDNDSLNLVMSTDSHRFPMEIKKNKYFRRDGKWKEDPLIELINCLYGVLDNFRLDEDRNIQMAKKSQKQQQPTSEQSMARSTGSITTCSSAKTTTK